MGDYSFAIYKDKAGEFRWRFEAPNGQIMATSGEGYTERNDCREAVVKIQSEAAAAHIRVLDS